MRFGFVARFISALAVLAILVFLMPQLIGYQSSRPLQPEIAPKQQIPQTSILPDFAAITDIRVKKAAFFDFIKPGVIHANNAIAADRAIVLQAQQQLVAAQPLTELTKLKQIAQYYRLGQQPIEQQLIAQLLMRVDTIPADLILVQAANESGWGTSRFARLGLNFFGQWCFSKGCGLVPSSRNESANHEVEIFDSVDHSIASYLRNLNTHAAYQHLRQIRAQLRANDLTVEAQLLVVGLRNYSQRKDDYVIELLQMLRHNKAYL
ncbi:MAG: glucosaminidase domain-containing protein [Gammaproteobacteria bacterium]|nr:glucosaminidase domain-containing protein [Gammaproteobacteria bacterium]